MNKYRVLMAETVNGEQFSFAISVSAGSDLHAAVKACIEFPEALILSATRKFKEKL